ncbi:MAG: SNF2 helicase-associated domain-containing protein, partial [Rhodothermales bacterium]
MIILHLGFLSGGFYLWAEVAAASSAKSAKAKKTTRKSTKANDLAHLRWSPFNPTEAQFSEALWEADLSFDVETTRTVKVWLPSTLKSPLPSSPILWENSVQLKGDVFISPWQITAIPLNNEQVIDLLVTCNKRAVLAPGILASEGLQFCATAFRYANVLVTNEQFLPGLISENDRFYAKWLPVFLGEEATRLAVLAEAMPASVRALSNERAQSNEEAPSQPAAIILKEILGLFVDHLVRDIGVVAQKSSDSPAVFDSVHDQWLYALSASEGNMTAPWADLAHLNEKIEEWQHSISVSAQTSFLLVFRLEEPVLNGIDENTWYIRFLLQAVDDPSLLVDVEKAWDPDKQTASLFNKRGFSPHEYLLVSLGQAAGLVSIMEEPLKKSRPGGFEIGTQEAFRFLTETAWLLRQSGFGVLLPSWWIRKGTRGRLSAHATVKSPIMKSNSGLSLDNLVQFDWQVALGDEVLTREEIDALSRAKMPLINLRGQWVHVDLDTIKAVVEYWKKSGAEEMTARQIVQMALGMSKAPGELSFEGFEASGWIGDLLDQLKDDSTVEEQVVSEKFEGTLRPYQLRGYSWMAFHEQWGLGACLADDMGLGKTIQTLALIQKNYDKNLKRPVLLVCPTSVIGNWQKEVERFTPNLSVLLHHGTQR